MFCDCLFGILQCLVQVICAEVNVGEPDVGFAKIRVDFDGCLKIGCCSRVVSQALLGKSAVNQGPRVIGLMAERLIVALDGVRELPQFKLDQAAVVESARLVRVEGESLLKIGERLGVVLHQLADHPAVAPRGSVFWVESE